MEKIELDVLMYLRYGELGEGMDYNAIKDAVDDILSSPDNLDVFCEKCLKNEVYGPYFTKESLVKGLNAIYDSPMDTVLRFKSVEQAFQYAKTYFSSASAEELASCRQKILSVTNGKSLQIYGRSIPQLNQKAWDARKFDIMKDLIRESFLQNQQLGKNFVSKTEGFILTHEQDKSEWKELFPKALMEVREELKQLYQEQGIEERFEPRVFVSYYGSKHVPEDAFRVQISTSVPESMKDDMDIQFETLYPSYKNMVKPHKDGEIDDAEYSRRYNETVLEKNKDKILSNMAKVVDMAREEQKDVYLFCYCRPGAFCHRYLVNNFLNEHGIACQEVPEDRLMYQKGHVALFGEGYIPSDELQFEQEERLPIDKYMAEQFDFHAASCRCIINDNLETVNLPLPEVNGIALRNAISDAVDAGYDRNEIKECLLANYKSFETTVAQQMILDLAFSELVNGKKITLSLPDENQATDIVFTQSDGSYQRRTYENAQADDVDFTFAFAANFDTYGEKATAKAAGDSLIQVDIPMKSRGGIDLSDKGINNAVSQIASQLPDEFLQGEPCGVNIAGNGIYTMRDFKITQEDADKFLCLVGARLQQRGFKFMSVRTGGQTGMDEAGAVMGKVLGIPTTVHGPKNFQFRDVNGRDIKDEQAYLDRFAKKDYAGLKSAVEKALKPVEKKVKQISR